MLTAPAFIPSAVQHGSSFDGGISSSQNYTNIDSVNINSIMITYDPSISDMFVYHMRSYFVDTISPFAQSEASMVSIEYINFTSADNEILSNGSEYLSSGFNATVYDGVTSPDIEIIPIVNPIIVDFKQIFVVKFELPVMMYNDSGEPSADITVRITSFNNVSDTISLSDSTYSAVYHLKTDLLINSQHFSKNNVMIKIDDVQVDPFNFYVRSRQFDMKIFDLGGRLIYHQPNQNWSSSLYIDFTTVKITNDYYDSVLAAIAPIDIVDQSFYQSNGLNYSTSQGRFIQSGSFDSLFTGIVDFSSPILGLVQGALLPSDSDVLLTNTYNTFDGNINMPNSYNIITNPTTAKYPFLIVGYAGFQRGWSSWIRTPVNDTNTMLSVICGNYAVLESTGNVSSSSDVAVSFYNQTMYDSISYWAGNPSFNTSSLMNGTSSPQQTWHHVGIIETSMVNQTDYSVNYSLSIFVDFVNITSFNGYYPSSSYSPFVAIMAHNVTWASTWDGSIIVTPDQYGLNMSFDVANIISLTENIPSFATNNGASTMRYVDNVTFQWNTEPVTGYYGATDALYQGTTIDDYFNWQYFVSELYNLSAPPSYDTTGGFKYVDVSIIPYLDGHRKVMNASLGAVTLEFDYNTVADGSFEWATNNSYQPAENSTFECWINAKDSNSSMMMDNGGIFIVDQFYTHHYFTIRFNATSNIVYIHQYNYSTSIGSTVTVSTDLSKWHHYRIEFIGGTPNGKMNTYIDNSLVASFGLNTTNFPDFSFLPTSTSPLYIDAIGYWRSSWINDPVFKDFYTVGYNTQQISPIMSNGDYTFDDASSSQTVDEYSSSFLSLDGPGEFATIDAIHRTVMIKDSYPSWGSIFSIDFPNYNYDGLKLARGFGYEIKGRVAFWIYMNSTNGSAKFSFVVYDNNDSPGNELDDSMHAFSIGSVWHDNEEHSNIMYYHENDDGSNKTIVKTSYVVTNDTWHYVIFEWENDNNRLWVDGRSVFTDGKQIRFDDQYITVEYSPIDRSGGFPYNVWVSVYKSSAMSYFCKDNRFLYTDMTTDRNYRTVLLWKSIPTVTFSSQNDESGAVWKRSITYIDNIDVQSNFNDDAYVAAIPSTTGTPSNVTQYSMLTMCIDASIWSEYNLYDGALYNVSMYVTAPVGDIFYITFDDDRSYPVFITENGTISRTFPINTRRSCLQIDLWSIDGNFTITNVTVGLTSGTPEQIDSFKKFVADNAIFSDYITEHDSTITNMSTGEYYLLATTTFAEVASFDIINVTGGSNNFFITQPSLRQIVVVFTDQRGIFIDFNLFRTYQKIGDVFQLIPTNVFFAEVGTTILLLAENIFNEIVFYDYFTVSSLSNYINIVTIVHSLKTYNQREDFAYIEIRKDFAPGFYWSEWIAPSEIIEYRLTSGGYTIDVQDELSNSMTYVFDIYGDDVLLIASEFTIQKAIQDIKNVNTTIGNQITNVAINITNQNSAINNSIVNVDIRLDNINSTLGTQLLSIDAQILSVNSTINEQTAYIQTLMANLNSTIGEQSTFIESLIANVNSSIDEQTTVMLTYFTNINSTILQQSANLQQYMININNTINSIDVNLTQAFFTDLFNNQTGALTGYITSTVNNQTSQILFEINNVSAYISNELLNVNNNIYNQTIILNGTLNYQFTEIMSTNAQIEDLIRKTEFSTLINWSDDVEVAGIIRLTMMNSYSVPILVELRRDGNQENYTIYADNTISVYVPGGLYRYRIRNLVNNTFLPRIDNETEAEASIFKDFFVSNTSNYIETTFARIATPIIPVQTGIDPANLVVVFVFIGAFIAVIAIIWFSRSRSSMPESTPVGVSRSRSGGSSSQSKKSSRTSSSSGSSRTGGRKGILP